MGETKYVKTATTAALIVNQLLIEYRDCRVIKFLNIFLSEFLNSEGIFVIIVDGKG